jgi:hypothetical protein
MRAFKLGRPALAFLISLAFTPLVCRADSFSFDVPGSIPGTTTVFQTDRGITVGTYDFKLNAQFPQFPTIFGTYGFTFDGTNYETFLPGFIGPPPAAGTLFPFGDFRSYDQVDLLSFNKNGGIGYFAYNPVRSGEGVDCCGFVRSGLGDDFATETSLRALMLDDPANRVFTAPDGTRVQRTYDTWSYPTYINNEGQVVGNFFNGVTTGCDGLVVITCGGQFLLSDGNLYFNYTTIPNIFGIPANTQLVGFVENGDSGTFRPVPLPSSLILFTSGLLVLPLGLRRINRGSA